MKRETRKNNSTVSVWKGPGEHPPPAPSPPRRHPHFPPRLQAFTLCRQESNPASESTLPGLATRGQTCASPCLSPETRAGWGQEAKLPGPDLYPNVLVAEVLLFLEFNASPPGEAETRGLSEWIDAMAS